jgi:hypothetical protein
MPESGSILIPLISWDENYQICIKAVYYEDALPYLSEEEAVSPPTAIVDMRRFVEWNFFDSLIRNKLFFTSNYDVASGRPLLRKYRSRIFVILFWTVLRTKKR